MYVHMYTRIHKNQKKEFMNKKEFDIIAWMFLQKAPGMISLYDSIYVKF